MGKYETLAAIRVEIELSTDAWTDVSADVLYPITGKEGIGGFGPADVVADPGTMTFYLDNGQNNSAGLAGYYTPDHANVRTGFEVGKRVRLYVEYNGVKRYRFQGRIPPSGIKVPPDEFGERVTQVTVGDWFQQAQEHKIILPEFATDKRADEVVALIVANMPIAPDETDYNAGVSTFPFVFDTVRDETSAIREIQKVILSEFGFCYLKHSPTSGEILTTEGRTTRIGQAYKKVPPGRYDTDIGLLNIDAGRSAWDDYNPFLVTSSPYKFDSVVDSAAKLSVSGGVLTVDNSSTDAAYGTYVLGANITEAAVAFRYNNNGASVGGGGALLLFALFDGGNDNLDIRLTADGNLDYFYRTDTGGPVNNLYTLDANYHEYYIYWKAATAPAANDGILKIYVDGVLTVDITNIDNDTLVIDDVRIGTVFSSASSPSGSFKYDYVYADAGAGVYPLTTGRLKLQTTGGLIVAPGAQNVSFTNEMVGMPAMQSGKNMANRVSAVTYPREVSTDINLFSLQQPIKLNAGETREGYRITYRDPSGAATRTSGRNMQTPASTDYAANTASDGGGSDVSANLTVSVEYGTEGAEYTLANGTGATMWVTQLDARGDGVFLYDPVQYITEDTDLQNTHGLQPLKFGLYYQNEPSVGRDYSSKYLSLYKDPRHDPEPPTFCANTSANNMGFWLMGNVGDKFALQEDQISVDTDFFVQGMRWQIEQGNIIYYSVMPINAGGFNEWLLGVADASELGTTTNLAFDS